MSGVTLARGVVAVDGLPDTTGVTDGYQVTWDATLGVAYWGAAGGSGGGAPTGAQYVVAATDATLTAERLGTNTTTITWDFGTAGQAKLNVVDNTSTQKVEVVKNSGAVVGTRKQLNFVEGSNITLTIADDSINDQVDITIASTGGAGVTDGDKGDITVSGTGTVWTIDNTVVTFAKMQNIATDSLIGRDTAATGAPENITLNATLEFTGTGQIQRAALTGDVTATAGSNTTAIAANAVTDAKLRQGAATSVIGRSAGTTGNVADIAATADGDVLRRSGGALGFGAIPESSVTNLTTDLAAKQPNIQFKDEGVSIGTSGGTSNVDFVGAGVTATFATGTTTVTIPGTPPNADYGDITVAAGVWTIDNGVVTFAKMQNIATDSLIGRDTAGTGAPESITLDTTLEFSGSQTIRRAALAGDVTASAGSNTTTIANNAVTLAKMATITTDSLLGRDTAGVGNVEVIGVTGGIEFTTLGSIQTGAFTGDATKTAGGTALTLATVNSNVGTFGNATNVGTFTVNGKGLVTAASNTAIQIAESQVTNLTTDLAAKQPNIQFKDEGVAIGTSGGITNVDFVGAGVTATAASGTVTVTISGGGGGGTPGGSTTQVQFNDAGVFAGQSTFTFDKTNNILTVPSLTVTAATVLSGIITPTQLTADTNDWAPTGLSGASQIRIDVSKEIAITGLTGGATGRVLFLTNITDFPIIFVEESTASTAANRFTTTGDFILFPGQIVEIVYDGTTSRWRFPETNINIGMNIMFKQGAYF